MPNTTDPNAYIYLYYIGLLVVLVGSILAFVSLGAFGGARRNGQKLLAAGLYSLFTGQTFFWIATRWISDPDFHSVNGLEYPADLGLWIGFVGNVLLMGTLIALKGARWLLVIGAFVLSFVVGIGLTPLLYPDEFLMAVPLCGGA